MMSALCFYAIRIERGGKGTMCVFVMEFNTITFQGVFYLNLKESKKNLQPPYYLIIIVNRITYSNNRITKNKSRIPLDLYIKLGPYKFSLQASVDHHGYSMNSGHYTASINCCGKTFHCNDNKITECNITDTYNSSTAYILLYKLMLC